MHYIVHRYTAYVTDGGKYKLLSHASSIAAIALWRLQRHLGFAEEYVW
jgi:hypothetical protein